MTFKTINNTTPFFEGTDTHALVGHSSYSTTGTTSFTAIHTEVAGQEYVPFGAPATTNGPRRIGRDEFLEDENQDNTPTGVEQTQSNHPQSKKVLHNQQIYILHNGHTYTLTGLEVKW